MSIRINSTLSCILFSGLMLCMSACGDGISSYIPPALHPHTDSGSTEDTLEFTPHVDGEPYDSYKGLIMCGYQGWFGTPGDGSTLTQTSNEGWYHYRESEQFRPGVLRNSIDFWPDCSEYEKTYTPDEDDKYPSSPFYLPNGEKAKVFSSYDEQTVLTHFKWMKEYGIDGVFMQRFLGEVINNPRHKAHFDQVLDNAFKGSNTYQRAIAVMYDMSGANESYLNAMVTDAQEIMTKYALKDRSQNRYYLYENGKPLLSLWGVGFNGRTYDKYLPDIITKLKEQGWSIMLGCPAYWREGGGDAVTGTNFATLQTLIKMADVIMPWYVGRYSYDSFNDSWKNRIAQDISWCKANNIIYAVHVYPGGSDLNMHPNNGMTKNDDGSYTMTSEKTGNRYGGKFYWAQLANAIKKGATSIYVGMFDEMDEGTAIFKQLNVKDVPSNVYDGPDYYVNYKNGNYSISDDKDETATWSYPASELNVPFQGIDDDLPTDHYLWLTGQARKMLNREIKFTEDMPNR